MPNTDDLVIGLRLDTDFTQGKKEIVELGTVGSTSLDRLAVAAQALGIELKEFGEAFGFIKGGADFSTQEAGLNSLLAKLDQVDTRVKSFSAEEFRMEFDTAFSSVVANATEAGISLEKTRAALDSLSSQTEGLEKLRAGTDPASDAFRVLTAQINDNKVGMAGLRTEIQGTLSQTETLTDAEIKLAQAGIKTGKEFDRLTKELEENRVAAKGDAAAMAQLDAQERTLLQTKQSLGVITSQETQRLDELNASQKRNIDTDERLAQLNVVSTASIKKRIAAIDAEIAAGERDEFETGQLILQKARLEAQVKKATQATKVNVQTLSTAGFALQNFSFLTQDSAQFSQGLAAGMRAIGNNLDSMLFALIQVNIQMKEQNLSFGQFLKEAKTSPTVIAFASLALLNLATSAIQWIAAAKGAQKELNKLQDVGSSAVKVLTKDFVEFQAGSSLALRVLALDAKEFNSTVSLAFLTLEQLLGKGPPKPLILYGDILEALSGKSENLQKTWEEINDERLAELGITRDTTDAAKEALRVEAERQRVREETKSGGIAQDLQLAAAKVDEFLRSNENALGVARGQVDLYGSALGELGVDWSAIGEARDAALAEQESQVVKAKTQVSLYGDVLGDLGVQWEKIANAREESVGVEQVIAQEAQVETQVAKTAEAVKRATVERKAWYDVTVEADEGNRLFFTSLTGVVKQEDELYEQLKRLQPAVAGYTTKLREAASELEAQELLTDALILRYGEEGVALQNAEAQYDAARRRTQLLNLAYKELQVTTEEGVNFKLEAIEEEELNKVRETALEVQRLAAILNELPEVIAFRADVEQQKELLDIQTKREELASRSRTREQEIGRAKEFVDLEEARLETQQQYGRQASTQLQISGEVRKQLIDQLNKQQSIEGKLNVLKVARNKLLEGELDLDRRRTELGDENLQWEKNFLEFRQQEVTAAEQLVQLELTRDRLRSGRGENLVRDEKRVELSGRINENIRARVILASQELQAQEETVSREERRIARAQELLELQQSTRRIDILEDLEHELALQEEKNDNAFVEVELLQDYNNELAKRFALLDFDKEIAALLKLNTLQEESIALLREDEVLRRQLGLEGLVKELDALEKKNILGRERLDILYEEGSEQRERYKLETLKAAAISRQNALLKLQIIDSEEVGEQVVNEIDLLYQKNRIGGLRLRQIFEERRAGQLLTEQVRSENISLIEQVELLRLRAFWLQTDDPLAAQNRELEQQRETAQRTLDVLKAEKTTYEEIRDDVKLTARELNAENRLLVRQARLLNRNADLFASQLKAATLIGDVTSAYIDKLTGLERLDLGDVFSTDVFRRALAEADETLASFLEKYREVNRTPLLQVGDEFQQLKNNITASIEAVRQQKRVIAEPIDFTGWDPSAIGFIRVAEELEKINQAKLDLENPPDVSWVEELGIAFKEIFTTAEGFGVFTDNVGEMFNNLAGGFQNLFEAGDKENEKQFDRYKQFAIAATIISTLDAAVRSFKNAGGWPWGLAPAAAALFFGYSQVRKIQSMEPGKTSAGGASLSAAPSYFGSLGGQSLAGPGNVAPAEGTGASGTGGNIRQPVQGTPFQTQQASGQVVIESPSTSVEVSSPEVAVPQLPEFSVAAPNVSLNVAAPNVTLPELTAEAPEITLPELSVSVPELSLDVPEVSLPSFDPVFAPSFSPTLTPQFEVPTQETPVFAAPTAPVQPLTATSASSLTVEPINLNITIQGELRGSARSMVAAIKQEVNAQVASGITDPLGIQKSQQRISSRFS